MPGFRWTLISLALRAWPVAPLMWRLLLGPPLRPLDKPSPLPRSPAIALRVEPTDGIMYPDIALFDHLEGRIARILGQPPPMWVVVLDFGGSVDTLEFNRPNKDRSLTRLELEVEAAETLIEDGIRLGDPILIGQGATQSAIANQRLLFNPYLDAVLALSGTSKLCWGERGPQRSCTRDAFP